MQTRKLGPDLVVSSIGLGCMGMSEFYGEGDDAESMNVIHRAIDLGVTFFDTADMYGVGRNETLLGKALKAKRDGVVVATKFGNVRGPNGERLGINGRPDYVKKACDDSLTRLGIEVIDLYYQHRVDPNVPIEDTVGAMSRLVEAGKVRYLGLSEAAPATIRKAHATHPIAALQTEYSLWSREPEEEILPTLRELGIGFVPYSPLGRGFLTGRFKTPDDLPDGDFRKGSPRFTGANFTKNLKLVEIVEALAKRKGATASQLALAWVLAQGSDVAPIPGTKRVRYLEENADAVHVELSPDDLGELDEAFGAEAVAGTRYPEAAMKAVNL
ncbi:aldo/keto reductase [Aureimonas pseudogalii]|uniref:Aryl-alcohol dehydrogenase-like predicted oxidoreductase n=1 Tax=Aureimonas pseudogalii TaxID=1744844 RepID=A0A7W6E7R8_9HYPH|nr:aldo/keto reductase [Aureimonas pseudogalii]MBB3996263.1 aryl-alcohol dehydrogenase-like predicted oxidoreductase [Aureimonas pseudogalii]